MGREEDKEGGREEGGSAKVSVLLLDFMGTTAVAVGGSEAA